jgi:hypothetical protein
MFPQTMVDTCCCFCPSGSGARVFTSARPLGPFIERANINRQSGSGSPIVTAQQTWVGQIPTTQGTAYIWLGDRWGSRPDGINGHDFQFWSAPLKFDGEGNILPIGSVPSWQENVRTASNRPQRGAIYLWPRKSDPNPLRTDPCTNKPLEPRQFDGME